MEERVFHLHLEKPAKEVTEGTADTFDKVPGTGCLLLGDKGTALE
jgi:hypothetical protein